MAAATAAAAALAVLADWAPLALGAALLLLFDLELEESKRTFLRTVGSRIPNTFRNWMVDGVLFSNVILFLNGPPKWPPFCPEPFEIKTKTFRF